ncbi:Pyrophosphatase PpaX [compost metagenome]
MTTYLPRVRALPGTRALLDKLEALGLKRVIATSAKSDELAGLLRAADASELESSATTSDDADESKPEPDIVEAALRRAGVGADGAIMIGDTPYDVAAARRAGVRIVAFRSGGWDDAGLSGAIAVYDDPADLLAQFDSSPFGREAHNPSR